MQGTNALFPVHLFPFISISHFPFLTTFSLPSLYLFPPHTALLPLSLPSHCSLLFLSFCIPKLASHFNFSPLLLSPLSHFPSLLIFFLPSFHSHFLFYGSINHILIKLINLTINQISINYLLPLPFSFMILNSCIPPVHDNQHLTPPHTSLLFGLAVYVTLLNGEWCSDRDGKLLLVVRKEV